MEAPFNDKSICFRKAHLEGHKQPERELIRARQALQAGEADAAEEEAGNA